MSLAEITCPILAFVGEVDDIGQPLAVRGISQAAPRAKVYESTLRAGHFGLVVGSTAANHTWPTTGELVQWTGRVSDPLPGPYRAHGLRRTISQTRPECRSAIGSSTPWPRSPK